MTRLVDPTREELDAALTRLYPSSTLGDFEWEEAIFWFANDYYAGQWSELYKVLCASPYKPGPSTFGPSEGCAQWMYQDLVHEYFPVDLNETPEFM